MNQFDREQNRFLESPFAIRTNPQEQVFFGTKSDFSGGFAFSKDNFSMPMNDKKKELDKEAERIDEFDLISEK